MNNKKTGTFYTPTILSEFLVKHIFLKYLKINSLKILEPSCGDGQFISPLFNNHVLDKYESVRIDLTEINKEELDKAHKIIKGNKIKNLKVKATKCDYLDYEGTSYSLIFGNPPYINKKLLSKKEIGKCEKICNSFLPDIGETKNIWPAFLLKAINDLSDSGVLCFVLPSELLQVNYTYEIRKYLLEQFERIEIFAFNELIFPNIEQDVIVLIGIKRVEAENEKGVSFYQVEKLEDLKIPDYIEKHNNVHRKNLDKWTNYILSDGELNLIEGYINELELKKIIDYCSRVEVGIVTAANKYFIVNKEIVKKYKLNTIVKPLIMKGTQIKNSIRITSILMESLKEKNKAVNFLHISAKPKSKQNKNVNRYLLTGEKEKLQEKYKMTKRKTWYHVPSVWLSEGMFARRSHLYPRLFINDAKVYVTDSFYRILMKKDYNIENLAFSFFNTLTFVLAELEGRFYGGGVLELTPNEFKNLYIPYNQMITKAQVNHLEEMLHQNEPIETILNYTDSILLPSLSPSQLKTLSQIRTKLIDRRLKVSKENKKLIYYKEPEESLSKVAEL